MAGKTRIIAFDPGKDIPAEDGATLSGDAVQQETHETQQVDDEAEASSRPRLAWFAPALAVLAIAAWSGFFAWARQAEMSLGSAPGTWTGLVADWAIPVLLICVIWLLAMRNSRREAVRLGGTARTLSEESARLEARLLTINRELSLAREFITAQSRDLETLGRLATERLSQNADRLQTLIHDNSVQIDTIAGVSEAALNNMEKLRGQLPVIASSAKDVTNNIGNVGRTAHTHLIEMIEGFKRLNEFGLASEQQVQTFRGAVDEAIAEFTRQSGQLDEIASSRFAALAERGQEFRTQLEMDEVEALATIRNRAAALAEELEQARQLLDGHEEQSLTSLRARLSSLRDESGAIARSLRENEARAVESWREALARLEEEIGQKIALLEKAEAEAMQASRSRLDALSEEAVGIEAKISESSRAFANDMEQRRNEALTNEEVAIARLSARLAELDANIAERRAAHERQSAALAAHGETIMARLVEFEQQSSQISKLGSEAEAGLSASLQALATRLAESRGALAGTDKEISALTDASVRLLELIRASTEHSRNELADTLGASEERLAAIEKSVSTLRNVIGEASDQGNSLAGQLTASAAELQSAFSEIDQLHTSLEQRGAMHGETLAELRQALEELDRQSLDYAEKARGELSEAIEKLGIRGRETIEGISRQGSETVSALASQLAEESAETIEKTMRGTISEMAGQIEAATAHAAGVSREAATQLRNQLVKINELAGNLEKRVAHARERAEEQVNNDFSRRAALITNRSIPMPSTSRKCSRTKFRKRRGRPICAVNAASSRAAPSACSKTAKPRPFPRSTKTIATSMSTSAATSTISRRCCARCFPRETAISLALRCCPPTWASFTSRWPSRSNACGAERSARMR